MPLPLPLIFFGGEGAALCFSAGQGSEGKGAACGTRAEPPRPQGLPLPSDCGPAILFRRPRAKENVLHHGGEAARPPRAPGVGG